METYVCELFWPAIQPAVWQLPFREPPRQCFLIDVVQSVQDRQCAHTDPHCGPQGSSFQKHFFLPARRMRAHSPIAAWLSAPITAPNPPSKFRHRKMYPAVFPASSSPSRPRSERAFTAQYKNRTSISPYLSPANTPDGCCSDRMTGGAVVSSQPSVLVDNEEGTCNS